MIAVQLAQFAIEAFGIAALGAVAVKLIGWHYA